MQVFEFAIPMRWGDMDAMAHLNNTLYIRMMEEARIQWFLKMGIMTGPGGLGPILAHIRCDFIKPAVFPCTMRVVHTVSRIGRSSLDHDILIADDADPSVVYAKGMSTLVWMNYQTGKSEPWPAEVIQAIQA